MTIRRRPIFSCEGINISTESKSIVNGVNLEIFPGEIHALMGPNGSGKSTFASGIMGHPAFLLDGKIWLGEDSIHDLPTHERAQKGLFLGFQYPVAVPGVTVASFLRASLVAVGKGSPDVFSFRTKLESAFAKLSIPWSFADRYLNDGFSGGEKKRLEILQMMMMKPKFVILDEIDSGLDVDALKVVSKGINDIAQQGAGVLMVTHYQRLLDLVVPSQVHYFMDGKIAFKGDAQTVKELEAHGYEWLRRRIESNTSEVRV